MIVEPTVTLTASEYAKFWQQTTLRDQFAMAALPGLLNKDNIDNAKLAAQVAYAVADRMLEVRKEKK